MQNLINRIIVFVGIPFLRLMLRVPEEWLNAERRAEITEVLEAYDKRKSRHAL